MGGLTTVASALLVVALVSQAAAGAAAATPLSRPLVVAHRGASGMLPEHTMPAYQLAIAQGADFIECDVLATRDLQLVCRHDPALDTTTDAALHFG
jgi:glycerophosphoryl diester phosphodiesterase